jgi:hypothetical protein
MKPTNFRRFSKSRGLHPSTRCGVNLGCCLGGATVAVLFPAAHDPGIFLAGFSFMAFALNLGIWFWGSD